MKDKFQEISLIHKFLKLSLERIIVHGIMTHTIQKAQYSQALGPFGLDGSILGCLTISWPLMALYT